MRRIFQKWLFMCIVTAFCATMTTSYILQTDQSHKNAARLLSVNLEDALNDVRDTHSHRDILWQMLATNGIAKARSLAWAIAADPAILHNATQFNELLHTLDVDEVHVTDAQGIIIASSDNIIGYDMRQNPQSAAFLPALTRPDFAFAQKPMPRAVDNILTQFAGVARKDAPGIVQIGYTANRLLTIHKIADIEKLATYYHIGVNGFLLIAKDTLIISSKNPKDIGKNYAIYNVTPDNLMPRTPFWVTVDNARYYTLSLIAAPYTLLAFLPEKEVYAGRDTMLLYVAIANVLLFALVFFLVTYLLQRLVVDDVYRVNAALERVTHGRLNTTLDAHATPEFREISARVNTMVESLKNAIAHEAARIDAELDFARRIQLSVLPNVFPPYPTRTEFEIYARMRAAKSVGGDLYDFTLADEDHLTVVVADVAAKGIGAALFMMTVKALLKNLTEAKLSPAAICARANTVLNTNNEAKTSLTVFVGVLCISTGVFTYCNAGHKPPLRYTALENTWSFIRAQGGMALAAQEGGSYAEQSLRLAPGDRLLLYTDGVTEAANPHKERFTEQRLAQWLYGRGATDLRVLTDDLLQELDTFAHGTEQTDDIALLLLAYHGA